MAVILGGKAKMPCIYRSIFCLLHRAQGKAADQWLLWRVLYLFQQLLDFLGMDFLLPYPDGIAKIIDKQSQLLDFFRVWGPCHPILLPFYLTHPPVSGFADTPDYQGNTAGENDGKTDFPL